MAIIRKIKLKAGTAHQLIYYLNNKRYFKYFPPKVPSKIVQAEKKRIEREILLGKFNSKEIDIPILTQKIKLEDFADWYKNIRQTDPDLLCATSTLQRYIIAIKTFTTVIGLKKPLSDITTNDINQFKLKQIENNKTRAGINKDLHHLKNPFKLARQHNLITRDIQITKFKVRKQLPDYLTPSEMDLLFENLPKGQVQVHLAATIIKWTGIRRTELCERCTKSDFNFEAGYLTIHGKNNEDQTVPIHPELTDYLNQNQIFQYKKTNRSHNNYKQALNFRRHQSSQKTSKYKQKRQNTFAPPHPGNQPNQSRLRSERSTRVIET